MWKATKASLLAHKLRLILTALAVSAGVGFVCGTLVLTDTLGASFDRLFTEISAGKDVIVSKIAATGDPDDFPQPVEDSFIAKVGAIDGVQEARGDLFTPFAQVIGPDGEPVAALPGTPSVGVSHQDGPMSSTQVADGRAPKGPDEVAIDRATAEAAKLKPGDRLRVITPATNREYTISGTLTFGESDNLNGATQVAWDLPTTQVALGRPGFVDQIEVKAEEGVKDTVLRDRIAKELGAGYKVQTGEENAGDQADQIREGLSFINYFLGGFGIIALLVGSFIIVNTFTILVAQRTRELALLRALGASRRQVMGSVLGEAAATGTIGSLVGAAGGVVLAFLLLAVLSAVGFGPAVEVPAVRPRTILVGLGVGLVVTLFAAAVPAFRASRVPPVAAMGGNTPIRATSIWVAIAVRVGMIAAGVAMFVAVPGIVAKAFAALLVFVGLILGLSLVAAPLAGLVGIPLSAAGVVGRLGQKNTTRNPRRTASTAAALMVGLALVGGAGTMQASAVASIGQLVDGTISADLIVEGGFLGLPPSVGDSLQGQPGIASAASVGFAQAKVGEDRTRLTALSSDGARLLTLEFLEGSVDALRDPGNVLVSEQEAEEKKLTVGSRFDAAFPTASRTLTVAGIYQPSQFAGPYVIAQRLYRETTPEAIDQFVLVGVVKGQEAAARASVDEVADGVPSASVKTRAEFIEDRKSRTEVLLFVILALLVLSVLIAVLGVVNTLALSVYERIRELGLLRAVGARRGQLAMMVFVESILVALIGGVLGLGIGVLIGAGLFQQAAGEGLTELVIPWGMLIAGVVFSVVAGVIAALFPAFRATRLNILESIAVE